MGPIAYLAQTEQQLSFIITRGGRWGGASTYKNLQFFRENHKKSDINRIEKCLGVIVKVARDINGVLMLVDSESLLLLRVSPCSKGVSLCYCAYLGL